MNIIDERNTRTLYRKLRKKAFDERMKLSVSTGERVRLLDEGMVVSASGDPLFYIKKGVLRRYLDSLPDDHVGTINLGHMEFATFPFILGTWTKNDLHLVDIGEGRQALDVDLHLDEESFIVKELRRQGITVGVSAEFSFHVDERNSNKYHLEILDQIFIRNFAIVGEAGNVNSSDIRLGGNMTIQELQSAIDSAAPDLTEINKKLDALLEAEPAEEAQEEAEQPAEEAQEPAEEAKEEEVEETATEQEEAAEKAEAAVEEASEDETEDEAEPEQLSAVAAAMESLAKENAELRAKNEALTAKLAARDKAEQDFIARFKKLSVSVSSTESVTMEEAKAPTANVYTDGIGEI